MLFPSRIFRALTFLLFLSLICVNVRAEPMAVIAPNQPTFDKKSDPEKGKAESRDFEAELLLGLVYPFSYSGEDMDMPQMFAAIIFSEGESGLEHERRDLLGDLEEIRHLQTRAWGANVALDKAGLYQFIMESKPWWNEEEQKFLRWNAKVVVPVLGKEEGWNAPIGLGLEILPLTRPFGLTAPALFSGRIIQDGKPRENATVEMGYINSPKQKAPTEWHKVFKAKTDSLGQFSFVLNRPGWWYCKVDSKESPLKGPDGQMKDLTASSLLWLYVDGVPAAKSK